ncbi:unnamed protein product [Prorocentrum cordatum]|uniref:Uncharacterized protein n=1 Tax=Prorocentrum cordatum TaxID=2364126 RepID=A0ABN9VNW9_9DINO|nr:unnamed protein product [Polarella glacialis]
MGYDVVEPQTTQRPLRQNTTHSNFQPRAPRDKPSEPTKWWQTGYYQVRARAETSAQGASLRRPRQDRALGWTGFEACRQMRIGQSESWHYRSNSEFCGGTTIAGTLFVVSRPGPTRSSTSSTESGSAP